MELRPAGPADLPTRLEIYNEAVLNTTATWDLLPRTPVEHAEWYATKAEHGHPLLVAEVEGRVVGYAAYGPFREKAGYAATMEHSVYVAPGHQGRGIGRALLVAIVAAARKDGVHALIGGLSAARRIGRRRSGRSIQRIELLLGIHHFLALSRPSG